MFDGFPEYPRFRALKLREELLVGEDVYAWQTAAAALGFATRADGVFGPKTAAMTEQVQDRLALEPDGIVGPRTWGEAVNEIAIEARKEHRVAIGALYGQLAHESGLFGGNYSPLREDSSAVADRGSGLVGFSFDAGVAQRNSSHTPLEEGFDVPASIFVLAKNTREYYDLFEGVEKERRWDLAQGAWNAPAFACWIANEEGASVARNRTARPGPTARATFERYMESVTVYRR